MSLPVISGVMIQKPASFVYVIEPFESFSSNLPDTTPTLWSGFGSRTLESSTLHVTEGTYSGKWTAAYNAGGAISTSNFDATIGDGIYFSKAFLDVYVESIGGDPYPSSQYVEFSANSTTPSLSSTATTPAEQTGFFTLEVDLTAVDRTDMFLSIKVAGTTSTDPATPNNVFYLDNLRLKL